MPAWEAAVATPQRRVNSSSCQRSVAVVSVRSPGADRESSSSNVPSKTSPCSRRISRISRKVASSGCVAVPGPVNRGTTASPLCRYRSSFRFVRWRLGRPRRPFMGAAADSTTITVAASDAAPKPKQGAKKGAHRHLPMSMTSMPARFKRITITDGGATLSSFRGNGQSSVQHELAEYLPAGLPPETYQG